MMKEHGRRLVAPAYENGEKGMQVKGKKSYYYKFLTSFMLMLLLPVLTIILIFFQAYGIVKEQTVSKSRNSLEHFFQYVDSTMEGVKDTCISVAFESQYTELSRQFISNPDKHAYYVWVLSQELSEYKKEKYEDIFVYYPQNDYVISALGRGCDLENYYKLFYDGQGEYKEEFYEIAKSPYKKPMLYSMNGHGDNSYQCVALRTGYYGKEENEFVIVTVLKHSYMKELLQGIAEEESGISFILNADKEVIFTTENSIAEESIEIYSEAEDAYECSIAGEKYMMLSRPSDQLSAYYVYAVSDSYFWSELDKITVIFLIGLIFSIVLGMMIAYWQTVRIYMPFRLTMGRLQKNSIDQWDAEINTELEFIEQLFGQETREKQTLGIVAKEGREIKKNRFLLALLNGEVVSSRPAKELFEENGIFPCSDNFCVAVLRAEASAGLEKDLFHFVISNVLEETLCEKHIGYVIPMVTDRYGVLINMNSQYEGIEEIANLIEKGLLFLEEYYDLKFTMGISMVEQGIAGIAEAYDEAVSALKYSFLLGSGITIEYSQIKDREFKCPQSFELYNLVADFVLEKNSDKELALKRVNDCIENYRIDETASMDMVECFRFETVNAFNRFMHQTGCWNQEWKECIMGLVKCYDFDEFKKKFVGLLVNISLKQQENEENADICARARDYIEANYWDNQLSLAMLANKFGRTPSYFSKMFKEKYQYSIPDYIVMTRIRHGKELLCNTTDNIQAIAMAVGFLDDNAFIKWFKKLEGITPGKFRNLSE